jgi:hypothetical protein
MTPDQEIKHPKDSIILWENLLFVTARSGGSYYLLHPISWGNLLIKILDVEKEKKKIHLPLQISEFPRIAEHFHLMPKLVR